MTSKITLYSEKELIEQIKVYAKEQNSSVSKIVNEFFINLLETKKPLHQNDTKKSKITDSLLGRLEGKDMDEKLYHKHLEDKYL